MASLQQLKSRMKTVENTRKITNGMTLLASVRFNKWVHQLKESTLYFRKQSQIIRRVFINREIITPYNKEYKEATHRLMILVTSNMGLCSSYNMNIIRYLEDRLEPTDDILVIGSQGASYFKAKGIPTINQFVDLKLGPDGLIPQEFIDYLFETYPQGKYKSVKFFYTRYVNALNFKPTLDTIFPFNFYLDGEYESEVSEHILKEQTFGGIVVEPNEENLFEELSTTYISGVLTRFILESFSCEEASRRNAMDNATKNADDLTEELTLTYNKKRQENITNDINEIVGGSLNRD